MQEIFNILCFFACWLWRRSADSVIKKHKNSILWIDGDLNLPDIEWPRCRISGNQYFKAVNEEFLSFLEENALQQMVTTATREYPGPLYHK